MRFSVFWSFFLKVKTSRKGEKQLNTISSLLGIELVNVEMERYWKDESLYKATACSSFEAVDAKEGLYLSMTKLNRLGGQWLVTGPLEGQSLAFEATTLSGDSTRKHLGIEFITFECSSDLNTMGPALPFEIRPAGMNEEK